MTEYLVRWEKLPLAWVLYEAESEDSMFQQVADNPLLANTDLEGAQEWAMLFIYEHGNSKDFILKGPGNWTANGNTRKR